MDIFGDHWHNHPEKIARACRAVVEPDDLLLMPGDLSWAMRRAEADVDLAWIAALPGVKVLAKGNHDYWWDSDRTLGYPGLNDTPFVSSDGRVGVAGTRGWAGIGPQMTPEERRQSEKIITREIGRLTKRLGAIRDCGLKIALIHYPPIPEFVDVLTAAGVSVVLYGHLHLNTTDFIPPEDWHGMRAICVACDRLQFTPRLVAKLD